MKSKWVHTKFFIGRDLMTGLLCHIQYNQIAEYHRVRKRSRRGTGTVGCSPSIQNVSSTLFITTVAETQEGWLSPTERVSVTVSAMSLRHILASPGYAPGTIAVNVAWMKRGFNACQTHRSMYPSIFNRFPVIQPVSSKVRHFSTSYSDIGRKLQLFPTPLHLTPPLGVFPLEFRENVWSSEN